MAQDFIRVRGARQHNLKNLDLDLPRQQMVVLTGVSGSGKSSLAFDTLYAEGQRRYVQSLSAYARQFLDQLEKPDVDFIEGLSPAVAIEQAHSAPNPRSTIATVTEIYDYLRVLFAVAGHPHDPDTGEALHKTTPAEMGERLLALGEGTRLVVLAPQPPADAAALRQLLEKLRRQGFVRVRLDGEIVELEEDLKPPAASSVEVVVDRLVLREGVKPRLMESIETALRWNADEVRFLVNPGDDEQVLAFTTAFTNPQTGYSIGRLSPQHFSFNTRLGACPRCEGVGTLLAPDPGLIVPDADKSIKDGAVKTWWSRNPKLKAVHQRSLETLAKHFGAPLDVPYRDLPPAFQKALLHGTGREAIATGWAASGNKRSVAKPYEGLLHEARRLHANAESETLRAQVARYMNPLPCPDCAGRRLRREILAVTLASSDRPDAAPLSIHGFCALAIREALAWMRGLAMTEHEAGYVTDLQKEVLKRLEFLDQVGLGYLTLDRESGTLSGGETQRIRLASQIGAGLAGVLYVLDEPSVGLHPADTERLIATLRHLRDLGNTVLVVEHDEALIRAADHVVELGPAAGEHGGRLVAQGCPEEIAAQSNSLTGAYLAGRLRIAPPTHPGVRQADLALDGAALTVHGATEHNLQNVTATFPVGYFNVVTGPSGSGKSTLVNRVLMRALMRHFYRSKDEPGRHLSITGLEHFDKVVVVDQSPIGRSPRSNPATYTGAFTAIRELFAQLPMARVRGYEAGRFSFNTPGGRCEKCQGDGQIRIDMHFLADVHVTCDQCGGKRYNAETLEVTFKGRHIAEVLEMTVSEAARFFGRASAIASKLQTLEECGLGYLRLGQSGSTLSGGEAQRIKLAAELAKRATGRTLYLLDEPTTGLHFADIQTLLQVLFRLRDAGNTLIVIEHHPDVIRCADWILDLGPGGGSEGGHLIASGTPTQIRQNPASRTGHFLQLD
jgi:excinuclease ABC subunit A